VATSGEGETFQRTSHEERDMRSLLLTVREILDEEIAQKLA
jgi:hypothetical protein